MGHKIASLGGSLFTIKMFSKGKTQADNLKIIEKWIESTIIVPLEQDVINKDPENSYFGLITFEGKNKISCRYIFCISNKYFNGYPEYFYMNQTLMFTYRLVYILSNKVAYELFQKETLKKISVEKHTITKKILDKLHKKVAVLVKKSNVNVKDSNHTPMKIIENICCNTPKTTIKNGITIVNNKNCKNFINTMNIEKVMQNSGLVKKRTLRNMKLNCAKLKQMNKSGKLSRKRSKSR